MPTIDLSDGEQVAFTVFEPGRVTDRGGCNPLNRVQPRLIVFFKLNASGARSSAISASRSSTSQAAS